MESSEIKGVRGGGVGIRVVLSQPCSWKHFFSSLSHPKPDVEERFQLESGLKSLPMPLAGGAGCNSGLPRPPGTRKEASLRQDFLWRARKSKVGARSRGWEAPPVGRWCGRGGEPFVPSTSAWGKLVTSSSSSQLYHSQAWQPQVTSWAPET